MLHKYRHGGKNQNSSNGELISKFVVSVAIVKSSQVTYPTCPSWIGMYMKESTE